MRGADTARGASNQIARFGGDEFLLLLNDIERPEDAGQPLSLRWRQQLVDSNTEQAVLPATEQFAGAAIP